MMMMKKVTQVSLWLSAENREWPVVTQPSPALIWQRCRMRNTTEKTFETSNKAALAFSPLTTKWVLGFAALN